MKNLLLFLTLSACCMSAMAAGETTDCTFNWSQPATLTPAYPAPTADNRYGEYISNVTFTSGPVEFTVDDSSVKEQSQRARFLYGYNTQTVEMRAYVNSVLQIEVPESESIVSITFEGAKVTDTQLSYAGTYGTFKGSTWTVNPGESVHQVEFDVNATINCTGTTVTLATAGVDTVLADPTAGTSVWYTLQGTRLAAEPAAPGLYIVRNGANTTKIYLR